MLSLNSNESQYKTRLYGVSLLRSVAVFAVICIHLKMVSTPWKGMLHSAVPVFALLAGYFTAPVVDKDEFSLSKWISQRSARLLLPYLVWSVVYWCLNNIVLDHLIKGAPVLWPQASDFAKLLLLGGGGVHLWFLPCLFYSQIFLVCGLLLCGGKNKRVKRSAFLLLCCLLGLAGQCLDGETSASFAGYVRIYLSRLFFFLSVGGLVAQVDTALLLHLTQQRLTQIALIIVFFIGWGLLGFNVTNGLIGPHLLIAGALFGLSMWISSFSHGPFLAWLASVSDRCTMGVYLIHVLFTAAANELGARLGLLPFSVATGLTIALVIWGLCYCGVAFCLKNKFLRWAFA